MRLVAKAAIPTAVALSIGGAVFAQEKPAAPGVSTIELDGRAVRVQAIGLQNRRAGQPIIVFEAGATNSLEVWGGIVPEAAKLAPAVAYDRAGLGKSEWDEIRPTPRHVADRLQRVLQQLGAAPPYRSGRLFLGRHARAIFCRLSSRRHRAALCWWTRPRW